MQNKGNVSFGTKAMPRLPQSDKPKFESKEVMQHLPDVGQADTLCDSGINSLNSKGTLEAVDKYSFQTGVQPAQKADEGFPCCQPENIDEDLSKNMKAYLSSNAVPKGCASNHLEIQDKNNFVNFANCLIGGLRNCMTAAEKFSPDDDNYDQMKMKYATLKWKAENVSRLQRKYEEILKKDGAQSARVPQAKAVLKRRPLSLNISTRRGAGTESPAPQSPSPQALMSEKSNLRVIESQICDLAGALQLRLNPKLDGLRFTSQPSKYKVNIRIVPCEINRVAPKGSLSSFYRLSPLMGMTNGMEASEAELHAWVLEFQAQPASYLVDGLNTVVQGCSNPTKWNFSSTECVLPVEPGGALVTDVGPPKKNRKVYELTTFLTTEPRSITIELSILPSPYIEVEVKWLPITQMDLSNLEKYPPPQGLVKEWDHMGTMETDSQNMVYALLKGEQRRQESPSVVKKEHNLDGCFDSMRLEGNSPTKPATSRCSVVHSDGRNPLRAEHNISFARALHNSSSDNSISRECIMNAEHKEGDSDRSSDNEDESHSEDAIALASLLDTVQKEVKDINGNPNRYEALLDELGKVLQGLRDQLLSLSKIAANSSKFTFSPTSMNSEIEKSISLLDHAIRGSSAELVSPPETWTQPLSSGWDQLDSVIRWHLRHVSHLVQQLKSSPRFCKPSPDINNGKNKRLLCINEDLLAMALNVQSQILSDITGLVLARGEERDSFEFLKNCHCLAHCGTDDRVPLFSDTFWSRIVWHTPSPISGSSGLDETLRPTLMIRRTSLTEYLFQEYGPLETGDEDKQSLDCAIENLINKIMDLDLVDTRTWNEVPLTQLCSQLKLPNSQILAECAGKNPNLGRLSSRSRNALTQAASNAEPFISLALKYLIRQDRLQRELRESDEELLLRSLKILVDSLMAPGEATDRRSELMALSVDSFICLAHNLEHEDKSVTTCAGQAICALEDFTRSAYKVMSRGNPLPFLRTAGPCYAFLEELKVFSREVQSATSRLRSGTYVDEKVTDQGSGYSVMSPVGTAILWALQCPDAEDYRISALAAWDCFSTPTEISFGHSSGRPQSHQFKQQPKGGRRGRRDQDPIQAEVRHVNLADASSTVRRMALRILMSKQKCISIASFLDKSR